MLGYEGWENFVLVVLLVILMFKLCNDLNVGFPFRECAIRALDDVVQFLVHNGGQAAVRLIILY